MGVMRRAGPDQGPGMQGRAPGGRGNAAATVLRLRTQLALTDEQVKRLEALQAAPAPKANASDLLRARADLMDATQGDGNLARARAALDKMSALRNEQMIAGLKQRQDVRAVLTASQKTTLDNMRQELRGRARAQMMRRGRGAQGGAMRGGRPNGMQGGMPGPAFAPGQRRMMQPGQGPQGPVPPMPPRPRRRGETPFEVDSLR